MIEPNLTCKYYNFFQKALSNAKIYLAISALLYTTISDVFCSIIDDSQFQAVSIIVCILYAFSTWAFYTWLVAESLLFKGLLTEIASIVVAKDTYLFLKIKLSLEMWSNWIIFVSSQRTYNKYIIRYYSRLFLSQ